LALAGFSWRFIEQPFRLRAWGETRGRLFIYAGAGILASAVVGAALWGGGGLPQRYSPAVQRLLAAANESEPRQKQCFGIAPERVSFDHLCRIGASGVAPRFLLWGDSHADAMLPAVAKAAVSAGDAGLFAGSGRCPPVMEASRPDTPRCRPFNDAVLKVALDPRIDLVILDARWAKDAGAAPMGLEDEDRAVFLDARSKAPSPAETLAVVKRGLARTVRALVAAQKRVVIVSDVPEFTVLVPETLARMALTGRQQQIAPTREQYLARNADIDAMFAGIAKAYPMGFVHPERILCPGEICLTEVEGRSLYRDQHHLTVFGAEKLAPLFAPVFAKD
jgi:hypothetical protein